MLCPFCGASVPLYRFWQTANKPFCSNCGWNLNRARASVEGQAKTARIFLIVFLVGVAFATAVAIDKKEFSGLFPLALLFGIIAFSYAWNYWGAKRALNEAALAGKTDPAASGRAPLPPAYIQRIQTLSRPRKVKLRPTGRVSVLLFIMCLGIVASFIYVIADNARGGSFDWKSLWPVIPLLATVAALLGFMVFEFRKERKKLSLLRNGEVAVGRVVEQRVIQRGKQSYNEITYEFPLPGRPLIRKTERDHDKRHFEDMLIPVFYEPASPNDCAALCATYYHLPDAEN